MQGVALVGVFLRLAPFAERGRPGPRRRCWRPSAARLGRFFGKRGAAVVEANLAVIAAAYDSVIDVTAALARIGSRSAARAGAASMTRRPSMSIRTRAERRRAHEHRARSPSAPTSRCTEAEQLMSERRISGLPVVDA